jgi:hypothetical protein
MLSFFVTAGILVGFDASGHVAEETKNASLSAARGIFYSAVAAGLMGFPIVILFLFCVPDLDTLFSFNSPQPFVNLYVLALGQKAHVVMNVVSILGLMLVCSSFYPWINDRTLLLPLSLHLVSCLPLLEMACYPCQAGFPGFQSMVNPATPSKSSGQSPLSSYALFFPPQWHSHPSSPQRVSQPSPRTLL